MWTNWLRTQSLRGDTKKVLVKKVLMKKDLTKKVLDLYHKTNLDFRGLFGIFLL